MEGEARKKRLHHRQQRSGRAKPANSLRRPRHAHLRVRAARTQPQRHGRPLRISHHRAGSVRHLPGEDIQRDEHRRGIRQDAAAPVPSDRRQR